MALAEFNEELSKLLEAEERKCDSLLFAIITVILIYVYTYDMFLASS